MINRDVIKAEIDKVQDRYLDILYRVIRSFVNERDASAVPEAMASWEQFIDQTYGSLADDPISRGEQGQYEVREVVE